MEHGVNEYIQGNQERDKKGCALVVRNGKGQLRKVTLGAGTVEICALRIDDRREGRKFKSKNLPPYLLILANVENLLPLLYLKGFPSSDFGEALVNILGEGASAPIIKLDISVNKVGGGHEFDKWKKRKITERFVYLFADGANVMNRLGENQRLCLLVIIDVNESGEKKLLAVEPRYRKSKGSWSFVLRALKDRGFDAPLLAVGDGALDY